MKSARLSIGLFLVAVLSMLSAGCSDEKPASAPASQAVGPAAGSVSPSELHGLNNRAAALMDQQKISEAAELYRRITAAAPNEAVGWINLGVALLNIQHNDPKDREAAHAECEVVLRRAISLEPKSPNAHYTLGVLLRYLGRVDEAAPLFETTCRLAPEDPDANYAWGQALAGKRRFAEAAEHLRRAILYEPHFQGAWYVLGGVLARLNDPAGREEALGMFDKFASNANPMIGKKLEEKYNFMGHFACVIRTWPGGVNPETNNEPRLSFASREVLLNVARPTPVSPHGEVLKSGESIRTFIQSRVLPFLAGGFSFADFDGDGTQELHVADGFGVGRLYRLRDGQWNDETKTSGLSGTLTALGSTVGDFDHDGRLDLVLFGDGPLILARNIDGQQFECLPLGGAETIYRAAILLDADHDGDLDLLASGYLAAHIENQTASVDMRFPEDFPGARNVLWNNNRPTLFDSDKTPPVQFFTDISEQTLVGNGLQRTVGFAVLDVDRDGDVDLFEVNDGASNRLLLNDRLWRYRDGTSTFGVGDTGPANALLVRDLNQDGFEDIILSRSPAVGAILLNDAGKSFATRSPAGSGITSPSLAGRHAAADFDLDGRLDWIAVQEDDGGLAIHRHNGTMYDHATLIETGFGPGLAGFAVVDLNNDMRPDILAVSRTGGAVRFLNTTPTKNFALRLRLRGKEGFTPSETWANTFGIGTSLEVRVDSHRVYSDTRTVNDLGASTDSPVVIGLGPRSKCDMVRLIWPDLVIQSELDLEAAKIHTITEENRKPSSCPILFKHVGAGRFEFVTDFLGVGGLGFLVDHGAYAPADPTETVRIGELVPLDGHLEVRVAEPMEEICYLDELKLQVVEHPDGTEVFSDERLSTSNTMPSGQPLLFSERVRPEKVITRPGNDTTAETTRKDRVYQKDLRPDRRFIGYLAEEQHLVLEFAADRLETLRRSGRPLWLFVDGWVEYPYSHVNFAAIQAGVRAESFSIDIEGPDGTFVPALNQAGYPGGMSRTMALELTSVFSKGGTKLRLRTNLEVYVDDVWLASAVELLPGALREFTFDRAELRFLGYPREHSPDGRMPKIYNYHDVLPSFDWKEMSGDFTRFGDVRALLDQPENHCVILNHGEELVLSVAADKVGSPAAGRQQTFFLKAVGWCKDMDPLTGTPDTVEPLPFHGMSTYPWSKSPLDSAAPQPSEWESLWNTRRRNGTFPRGDGPR